MSPEPEAQAPEEEQDFQCPHCGGPIAVLIDAASVDRITEAGQ